VSGGRQRETRTAGGPLLLSIEVQLTLGREESLRLLNLHTCT